MTSSMCGWLAVCLLLGQVWSDPLPYHEPEPRGGVVSELGSRLAARLPPAERLPLPTLQELDAIKKVAQILVMLGEQVIPAIIGESPPRPAVACDSAPGEDVPNDPVADS